MKFEEPQGANHTVQDIKRLKAVAWMDDFKKASNPLDSIHPESEDHLAWTYVFFGWDDDSESWETRT